MVTYDIRKGIRKVKTKTALAISGATLGITGLVVALAMPLAAKAADNTVVVTPTHTNGWYVADQRPGGAYAYVNDQTSPYPTGALQLTTDANTASKIQYMHDTNTALSDVNQLSYWTKQNSGPPEAAASYQIATCLGGIVNGTCVGFTTLVYEPYWNGTVTPGSWQNWDVTSGLLWSSQNFTSGACTVVKSPGGPPTYTLSQLQTSCPNAVVVSYGVNVGTFNPLYNVEVDGFNFNGTIYNFEVTNQPDSKGTCKNGGWQNLTDGNGTAFKNQGDCVSYVATGGKNQANGH